MIQYIIFSILGYIVIAMGAYFYPAVIKGEKSSLDWQTFSLVWPAAIIFLVFNGIVFLGQQFEQFEIRIIERAKQKKLLKEQQQTKLLPASIDIPIAEPTTTDYRSMNCQRCGQIVK